MSIENARGEPPENKLSHPCKQTCSGWQQGYECGLSESGRLDKIEETLARILDAIHEYLGGWK